MRKRDQMCIRDRPYNSGGMFRGFLYKEKGSPEIKKGCGIGKKIVVVGEK